MTNKLIPGLPPPFEFVYDYTAPEPSSVDSLEGLLSWVDRIGCADQDRFKQARTPMWVFMQEGFCLGILSTPIVNDDFKRLGQDLVRAVLAEPAMGITHYGFINEAWVSLRPRNDPNLGVPASADPNRKDALLLSVHHRDGRQRSKTYLVDYDANGTPSRRLYLSPDSDIVAYGPMWDLFPEGGESTRVQQSVCPWCGYRHDRVSAIVDKRDNLTEEPRVDNEGHSISFCIACGECAIFDTRATGGLRFPTFDEWATLMTLHEIRHLSWAWRQSLQKLGKKPRHIRHQPEWKA